MDAEVRRILEECYVEARETLAGAREQLERLAQALLEAESLDAEQAYAIVRGDADHGSVAAAGETATAASAGGSGRDPYPVGATVPR